MKVLCLDKETAMPCMFYFVVGDMTTSSSIQRMV